MLSLRKIHILGFKSFCDSTELTVPGTGIAVVVGPNGCGKSNILDGMSWVLGEQSAKTLRGTQMQDVIFAGTRERKALGMAEVTLTLVDPAAYEGPVPVEPDVLVDCESTADWDEDELRRERAVEAEEIVAAEQPGQLIDEDTQNLPQPTAGVEGPHAVVLKIRRRKFQRQPEKGEVVITRRLFRTGESEYLLNGKLCRLRDIQEIFLGTGLGPDSYAIIGQEQIGQLLSSKPHDRRAIIEEAAGITQFKTKKRLAELRLESAKQNLSRVDDIFEEVTRQMNSLKRQAVKAERFVTVRDELRGRLRVVLASRMAVMDADEARLDKEIAGLTERVNSAAAEINELDANQHSLTERGYELDREGQEAQSRASEVAVELERAAARERANTERTSELETRIDSSAAELVVTRTQLGSIVEERAQQHTFLETAAGEARAYRQQVDARQQEARTAAEEVFLAERDLEISRRHAMHLLTQAGNARNYIAQGEESLAALEREAERLETEMGHARIELENLGAQSGQSRHRFDFATGRLQRLEGEIASLRESLQTRRAQENVLHARANQLRAEQATTVGRRDSLQVLIRNHGYSTDTVRQLLKPGALGQGVTPVGTLADFLEVNGEHEGVVDEFLREELNYIVVESWPAAEQGVKLLKSGVDGRATFLIHPAEQSILFEEPADSISGPGLTSLMDSIRVLNGFGRTLEFILPKLKNGYLVKESAEAKRLSAQYAHAFFLTPGGECFHNSTVTGGSPAGEGPLTLKRELCETENRLVVLEKNLAQTETDTAALTEAIQDMTAQADARTEERRLAERDVADQGAALKQIDVESQRVQRRVQEWTAQAARNKDARESEHSALIEKREDACRLEAEHAVAEAGLDELQGKLGTLRQNRESLQQEAAQVTAELAGLEERRRGAEAAFQRIDRLHSDLERRALVIEQHRAAGEAERAQRIQENVELVQHGQELAAIRVETLALVQMSADRAQALRQQLAALETQLKIRRVSLEQLRELRANRSNEVAKLRSDLEHLEVSCLTEVNVEAALLRADAEIAHLAEEALAAEEESCQVLRQRIEQMGPVNMMALDEYRETAGRHGFLEVQRKDLMESIANTQQTIKEIDLISRTKFEEALAKINENFAAVFADLFQGGHAFMRVTDTENQAESGLDIVASPPGKKLQNVLLLSGGEKALTALALLVAIFQFRPSPFCVLDEVDAPLDETNVSRFGDLMRVLSKDTQFIVVTHSKRMMQFADMIYGVTMQEPGVSKVVSVRLGSQGHHRVSA
jgi:chromosome segregation protein